MNLIPTTELTEFLLLPADVRQEIELWHSRLAALQPPIQKSLAAIAAAVGASAKTARRKYDAFRRHGWRGLINRARIPAQRANELSPEFIEYWKTLCEQNGRKCRPAYRELLRQMKSGSPIPGLPNNPTIQQSNNPLPPGLSYANLIRHKPTRLELAAARIGRGAAADYRPKLFTTRIGLEVGQRVIFDDLWHDFEVCMIGQRSSRRLLQLHAHDLLSACQFARGLKARIQDPDTGKSLNLTENEMLFLVAFWLGEFGFHPDGTIAMMEHGTANIDEATEELLYNLSGRKITIERSGIEGASAFAGQYPGRSKGNFRFKASLESSGNLIHNETASLVNIPGQTGSNSRINVPEELHGRKRHSDALLAAIAALPPQIASQLRLPFLEVNTAKWIVNEIMERINRRIDHEIEGWLELGFSTVDMHIPGIGILPAADYLALPDDKRAAVNAVATPAPRKLSPREVFDDGRKRLVRFRPEQVAMLLQTVSGREANVGGDYLIEFEDQNISPEPLRFVAHHFAPGDKFKCVINPWQPETCHLFDARGSWVGQVKSWQRIPHTDTEALHRQMGAAAKIEKELLAPLAARGAALTRKRLEDSQHNSGILAGQVKETQASIERTRETLRRAADDF